MNPHNCEQNVMHIESAQKYWHLANRKFGNEEYEQVSFLCILYSIHKNDRICNQLRVGQGKHFIAGNKRARYNLICFGHASGQKIKTIYDVCSFLSDVHHLHLILASNKMKEEETKTLIVHHHSGSHISSNKNIYIEFQYFKLSPHKHQI